MRLQMEMAEKLAEGFSPHAAFEAKHKQSGHDQTEEPGAAFLGFPQRRLRVAVAAVHRLEVTMHAAFGKSGLLRKASDALLPGFTNRVENDQALGPQSHGGGPCSEGWLKLCLKSALQSTRSTTHCPALETWPPEPTPYLTGEKVRGQQYIHVETDELAPGRGLLALGGGEQPLAFQDVPHRLIADAISQIAQGTYNAVIPPRAILAGHAHHEVFQLLGDARTSDRLTLRRTDLVLVHELAVPSEDSVRLRNRRDLLQCLSAQFVAHLGQRLPLSIGQQQPSCLNLIAQDAVFRRKIRIAQSEFFIDRACDRC